MTSVNNLIYKPLSFRDKLYRQNLNQHSHFLIFLSLLETQSSEENKKKKQTNNKQTELLVYFQEWRQQLENEHDDNQRSFLLSLSPPPPPPAAEAELILHSGVTVGVAGGYPSCL